jgi:peptidoglycan/LPS O-acetylase OafA/YrhL
MFLVGIVAIQALRTLPPDGSRIFRAGILAGGGGVPLITGASILLYKFVEKPGIALGRQMTRRKTPAAPEGPYA